MQVSITSNSWFKTLLRKLKDKGNMDKTDSISGPLIKEDIYIFEDGHGNFILGWQSLVKELASISSVQTSKYNIVFIRRILLLISH